MKCPLDGTNLVVTERWWDEGEEYIQGLCQTFPFPHLIDGPVARLVELFHHLT